MTYDSNEFNTTIKGKYMKIKVYRFNLYPNDITFGKNAILLTNINPLSK